jgi:hypothetical protein
VNLTLFQVKINVIVCKYSRETLRDIAKFENWFHVHLEAVLAIGVMYKDWADCTMRESAGTIQKMK